MTRNKSSGCLKNSSKCIPSAAGADGSECTAAWPKMERNIWVLHSGMDLWWFLLWRNVSPSTPHHSGSATGAFSSHLSPSGVQIPGFCSHVWQKALMVMRQMRESLQSAWILISVLFVTASDYFFIIVQIRSNRCWRCCRLIISNHSSYSRLTS